MPGSIYQQGTMHRAKNDKALEVLETAVKIDPGNDRIHYNMALLYNEMNNKAAAERSFAKAVQLKTNNPKGIL